MKAAVDRYREILFVERAGKLKSCIVILVVLARSGLEPFILFRTGAVLPLGAQGSPSGAASGHGPGAGASICCQYIDDVLIPKEKID
jgi:hypothetical protein